MFIHLLIKIHCQSFAVRSFVQSRLYFSVVKRYVCECVVLVLVNGVKTAKAACDYMCDAMQKTTIVTVLISGSQVYMCNEKWIISLLIELLTPTNYRVSHRCVSGRLVYISSEETDFFGIYFAQFWNNHRLDGILYRWVRCACVICVYWVLRVWYVRNCVT